MTADSVLSALIEVKGAREAIRAAESVQGALRSARDEAVLATNAVNRFGRTRGIAVLDIDSAKAQAQLQSAEKSVEGFARERGSATLDADAGRVRLVTAEATRQVRQFAATKATAVLDTDTRKITALGGELRRAGNDVDRLGSDFDGLHKSKSKTDTLIDKNVGTFGKLSQSIRGTSNATGGLRGNLGPLSGGLGIVATAALVLGTALLAIAGPAIAVVAALGPLVGLTAAVAGGLVAAAQGFAVFKLATSGVSDALKEQNTASRTAGSTALAQAGQQVSAARAIQGAQEALRGAREATARASRAVDEATRSERQAIAALGPAYTEARTRIRDLRDAVTGANLSLRDARFAANDARKALTDLLGGPSPRVLADAHLAVADAMRGERSAAIGLADATKALNDLLSPPAVLDLADARDAVADATRGQTRAQLDLAKQLTATNAVLADPGASEADKADARLRLADAENAVGDAARTSARAQEALSKLESPAAQDEIAKARGRVQDAEAAVALAKRDSRDAQAQLAKVESPAASDEIAKARLALAQAENQLSTATRDGARAASEYRTAEAQGIAQSPSVLAAREQLRAAALAGADAERALTDAQRAQGIAARGVSEAQADAARSAGVAAAAATNLSQKFDALPPAAQAFVRVLQSLKPRLDELRSTAASGFFPGATAGLKAAEGSFGAINSVVGETALVLGDAARKSGELVGSPAFAKDIQTIGSNNAKVLGTFGEALRHIISAFRHVVIAAAPLTQWLADVANKWALNAAESAKAGRETGKLAAFFEKTKAVAQRLGSILGSLGSGLLGVGKAGTTTGNDILKSIDRAAKRFDEWANSVKGQSSIREFFERTREIAAALLPALGNLAAGFTFLALKVLPVVTALQLLGPFADEAVIAFVSYKLAITAAAIASGVYNAVTATAIGRAIAWRAILVAATVAQGITTAAQWALNAALTANPIGLVVVAIAAFVAALVVAYKNSEKFRNIVDGAFGAVKAAASAVFPAIVSVIGTAWAVIKAITTTAWLLINAAIVTPIRAARDTIAEVVTGIANRLSAAWTTITGAASATWSGVRDTILGAVRAARDTISEVVTGIGTRLATGWATIKAAVTVAWDAVRSGILDPVRAARDAIGGVVEGIGNRIGAGWTAILAGARDFARDIKDAIVNAVRGAANAVLGLVNDIIGVINKIPGVEIPKIKELAQGGINAAKGGPAAKPGGFARGGFFGATGGFMDRPVAIGGEEAPCIARGTLIVTERGLRAIEKVRVGERVLTRNGYRPVVWSGITRRDAEVLRITSVDGDNVLCTPDHRVWAADGGTDGYGSGNGVGSGSLRGRGVLPHLEELQRCASSDVASRHDRPGHSAAMARCCGPGECSRCSASRVGDQDDVPSRCLRAIGGQADRRGVPAMAQCSPEREGTRDASSDPPTRPGGLAPCSVLQARAPANTGQRVYAAERRRRVQDVQGGGQPRVGACEESDRPRLRAGEPRCVQSLRGPEACWREAQSLRVGDWVWTLDDDGGLTPARIASIHAEERIDTYDLMVADDHEFVAGGILVHNSHPEYVIPTNPAYRGRAQMLLGQAAGAIGFAEGGVVSAFKSAIKTTNASEKPALALFEAGIVESGLRNLTYGDRDSLGALQLRAGIHGRELAMNPLGSALAFLTRGFTGRGGAISLADNYDTAGQVAQAVQGSAFPDRYDQVRGQAQEFLKGGGGIGGAIKGLLGDVGGVVGDLLSKGAGFLLDKLPGVGGLPDFLKGTGKYLLDKASSAIKDKVGNLLSSATGGNAGADLPKGVSGSISDAIGLAQSLGFAKPSVGQLTGGKHAPGSYHYQGRAADFGDAGHTAKQMDALYDALRAKFGSNIKELFYDTQPSYVKNGKSIAGQFGGHGDHIHIALAKGGIYGGGLLGSYAAGTDYVPQTGPYLLHKGESVAPAAASADGLGRGNVIITGPVTMRTDQQASVLASKLAFQLKYS